MEPSTNAAERDSGDWESTELGGHLRGRRTSDTNPELKLRSALHAQGLRYRLNRSIGRFRPDIVFVSARTAVFVDGCFWHGCPDHGPKQFRGPNAAKWREKIKLNKERDRRAVEELAGQGWRVVRLWECDVKQDVVAATERVHARLQEASESDSA